MLRYSQLTEFNLWLISVGIEERVVVFELNPVIKSLNVTKATVVFSLAVINELMYLHLSPARQVNVVIMEMGQTSCYPGRAL